MKKPKPARHNLSTLHQLCNLIPTHLVSKLARRFGIDKQSRSFSPWSHVVSLLFAQLTHAIGLNDVCDGLRHHGAKLGAIRGASAPSRNGLSHANRHRDSSLMAALFEAVLGSLQSIHPGFRGGGRQRRGLPRRFKRAMHVIDSTTITLVTNCIDWARHRRRKAAAKMHLRLDLQSFLPVFAIIEEAAHHDNTRMNRLCAALQPGEIVIFDKAYVHFKELFGLTARGVFWVTRAREDMKYHVCRRRLRRRQGNVLRDDEITLQVPLSRKHYPHRLRRVEAEVEIDGRLEVMVFLTNNFDWAPASIVELYGSRWAIEAFFKQIKQTLKVCDFLGHSKNAIQWQLWSALLLYVLLRFCAWLSQWPHSFTRLFALIRGVVWDRFDLSQTLLFYGTAGGPWRMCAQPQYTYLPGFAP